MRGTIEYAGTILAITDIVLRDGSFVVLASGTGPAPEHHGPVLVYGPDGVLVQAGGTVDCPAAKSGQEIGLELTMTPDSPEAMP